MTVFGRPARLGVLISGGGRTLLNLGDEIDAGRLDAVIPIVVASRPDIAGVERAKQRGLPVFVAARDDYPDPATRDEAILRVLDDADLDLILLAGYLRRFPVTERWRGRVLNIHPALLPEYGGRGMFGDHVHAAVLASGDPESGCTVHLVDDEYDTGPILLQRRCPVRPDDTVETLAARVFEEERLAYPDALRRILDGHIRPWE